MAQAERAADLQAQLAELQAAANVSRADAARRSELEASLATASSRFAELKVHVVGCWFACTPPIIMCIARAVLASASGCLAEPKARVACGDKAWYCV